MAPFDNFDESALGAFMESTLGVRGGYPPFASVWKLNSSGGETWTFDTGGNTYGIAVD